MKYKVEQTAINGFKALLEKLERASKLADELIKHKRHKKENVDEQKPNTKGSPGTSEN